MKHYIVLLCFSDCLLLVFIPGFLGTGSCAQHVMHAKRKIGQRDRIIRLGNAEKRELREEVVLVYY